MTPQQIVDQLEWESSTDSDYEIIENSKIDEIAVLAGGKPALALPNSYGGLWGGNHPYYAVVKGDQIAYIQPSVEAELR